jgi:hypothetical protein
VDSELLKDPQAGFSAGAYIHLGESPLEHARRQISSPVPGSPEDPFFQKGAYETFTPHDPKQEDANPKDRIGATKPDLSLVPPAGVIHEALAMEDGARKYGPYNWREKKVKARVYIAACKRHLDSYLDGEEHAEDSGAHHLGHARACLGILLDAKETGNLIDDRPKPGPAALLLKLNTRQVEK